MRIAITGGTGFVGGHLARALVDQGHEVILIARGLDRRDESIHLLSGARLVQAGVDDERELEEALQACDAVAHCAGINRQIGNQTYERVHVKGTEAVVAAARHAGVKKILLLSFLRARPACRSGYHESKWAAEETVRASGLDYTVLKAGVIYGSGDHMLDHLSHAFWTFPVFALVGLWDKPVRPVAIQDVLRVAAASLVEGRLSGQTVAVLGPEELLLGEAVRRVARAVGKKPAFFRMPVWFHYALAWCFERTMRIPLVSLAQVRILSEGLTEPSPPCEPMPEDLAPQTRFTDEQIRKGLPEARTFGLRDLRCFSEGRS